MCDAPAALFFFTIGGIKVEGMSELELFHELRESERELTVLKMKIKGIEKPVIATVEKIIGKTEVILKPYTWMGERHQNTVIRIDRIEKVAKVHLMYSHLLFPMIKPQVKPKGRKRAA